MNNILVIGDVHGKTIEYAGKLVKHSGCTIQVGDFGFDRAHNWHLNTINNKRHKINFGNHDDPNFLNREHSCGNFSFYENGRVMTIRGAYSTDKDHRIEGYDWWPEEEMTYQEMQECIDAYVDKKPEIVVSHDCPLTARRILFNIHDRPCTAVGLERMFSAHQPDRWIFGHHHWHRYQVINGTFFLSLAELEVFPIT